MAKTAAAVDLAHALAGELQTTEAALSKVSGLMGAVVDYAKARPVFGGYKAARYSKKYLAEHKAPQQAFSKQTGNLGGIITAFSKYSKHYDEPFRICFE